MGELGAINKGRERFLLRFLLEAIANIEGGDEVVPKNVEVLGVQA